MLKRGQLPPNTHIVYQKVLEPRNTSMISMDWQRGEQLPPSMVVPPNSRAAAGISNNANPQPFNNATGKEMRSLQHFSALFGRDLTSPRTPLPSTSFNDPRGVPEWLRTGQAEPTGVPMDVEYPRRRSAKDKERHGMSLHEMMTTTRQTQRPAHLVNRPMQTAPKQRLGSAKTISERRPMAISPPRRRWDPMEESRVSLEAPPPLPELNPSTVSRSIPSTRRAPRHTHPVQVPPPLLYDVTRAMNIDVEETKEARERVEVDNQMLKPTPSIRIPMRTTRSSRTIAVVNGGNSLNEPQTIPIQVHPAPERPRRSRENQSDEARRRPRME